MKHFGMAWLTAAVIGVAACPMNAAADESSEEATTEEATTTISTVLTSDEFLMTNFTTYTTSATYLTAESSEITQSCVSDSDLPVFMDDGNGHQIYRGTNCLNNAYLLLSSNAKTTYAIGEVLDLSQLKLLLVEERRFNIYHYDVTSAIVLVETNFDSSQAGTYFVTVNTTYSLSEQETFDSITFEVTVDKSLPKVTAPPDEQQSGVLTETTTVTVTGDAVQTERTTDEVALTTAPKYLNGDINQDGETTIADVIIHANFCCENSTLSTEDVQMMIENGDIDQNGVINAEDTSLMILTIAKLL